MLIQTFSYVIPPKFLHVLQMPSHFLDLPFLGFFSSRFILCQLLVPLQPPESQQNQQTLSSLPHTHTKPVFQADPIAYPSQLFFSSVKCPAVSPTPSLYACLTTGSQDGTEIHHLTRRKEHAKKLKGCTEKQLTPSLTPPREPPTCTQNQMLC